MRAALAGAFALGFAVGVLALAVLLWGAGWLHPRQETRVNSPPAFTLPAPDWSAANRLPAQRPVSIPEPAPPSRGEAQRSATEQTEPPRLAMPIAGVDPRTLAIDVLTPRNGGNPVALAIPAPLGTPVTAAAEGNVAKLFHNKEDGLTVCQFDNAQNWCFCYARLDRYAPSLKEGMLLRTGDVLGYVGTAGGAPSEPPHLRFAVFRLGPRQKWTEGTAVDPLPLLR